MKWLKKKHYCKNPITSDSQKKRLLLLVKIWAKDAVGIANSVVRDQNVPSEAVWSGSTPFAHSCQSKSYDQYATYFFANISVPLSTIYIIPLCTTGKHRHTVRPFTIAPRLTYKEDMTEYANWSSRGLYTTIYITPLCTTGKYRFTIRPFTTAPRLTYKEDITEC